MLILKTYSILDMRLKITYQDPPVSAFNFFAAKQNSERQQYLALCMKGPHCLHRRYLIMHNSRDAETGNEHHSSGADWQRIMSPNGYVDVLSSILAYLNSEDCDNLRRVSRSMWENMDVFKTAYRPRFQSLFLPDVCVQHLKEGMLDACTRYLSTTSFSVLFFGSSGL